MGIKGLIQENPPAAGSVCVEKRNEKPNHCFIFPPNNVDMVAHTIERRNNHWFVKTKASSDLTVQIENKCFHLHKIPMALKSGYINRLAFRSNGSSSDSNLSSIIQMDSIPGGAKIFEQVVRFCYGLKINATATNIAPLYCAAHFLEMNDDLDPGNLISKAEAFLSFIVLSSWKDTFRVVRSCESVSTWAKDLQIVKQCSESIAWKACSDTNTSSFISNEVYLNVLGKTSTDDDKNLPSNWWFEDASTLRIDHFIELVSSIKKRRKIKPELVGSCIAHWTKKWLPRVRIGKQKSNNDNDDDLTIRLHRVTLECLIRILPNEENSVSCNFLLHLYKIGVGMRIESELVNQVKTRIAMMLERCRAKDLLVKNTTTLFDVEIVAKVVEAYAFQHMISGKTEVAKLVDEYMVLVARDESLPANKFQMLVQVLPKEARSCDDNLYTAIDMYLKAHPNLTDEERTEICRTLEYHKLSQEARTHVMRNHRLPESMMVRFILLEQVSMARLSGSFSCSSGHERRNPSGAVVRISKELRMRSQKDVKVMKKDVEMLKIQVGKLQMCRMELQRQIKKPALI
nr:root phototropism protein 3-like [Ipomoea batatas]